MRVDEIEPLFEKLIKRIAGLELALIHNGICYCGGKVSVIKTEGGRPLSFEEGMKYTCERCGFILWESSNRKKVLTPVPR